MARTKGKTANADARDLGPSHDGLFHVVFSVPKNAASQLQTLLPKDVVRRIRWDTMRRRPGSHSDAKLTKRYSDVLYEVEIDDKQALIYVLYEHNCARQVGQGFVPPKLTMTLWAEGPTPHAV